MIGGLVCRLFNKIIVFSFVCALLCQNIAWAAAPSHLQPDYRQIMDGEIKDLLQRAASPPAHRFRQDIYDALEEELYREDYPEGKVGQILNRGLAYMENGRIQYQEDRVFEIAARVLNRVLRKNDYEQLTPKQVKAVVEYHEGIHQALKTNKGIIAVTGRALERIRGKDHQSLFSCFRNQYGHYSKSSKLVEELIASYFTEKIILNSLELLDDEDELITIDQISTRIAQIIEDKAGKLIEDNVNISDLEHREALEQLIDIRREKRRRQAAGELETEAAEDVELPSEFVNAEDAEEIAEHVQLEPGPEPKPESEAEPAPEPEARQEPEPEPDSEPEPDPAKEKLEQMSEDDIIALAERNYGVIVKMAKEAGISKAEMYGFLEEKRLLDRTREVFKERILELAEENYGYLKKMADIVNLGYHLFKTMLDQAGLITQVKKIFNRKMLELAEENHGYLKRMAGIMNMGPEDLRSLLADTDLSPQVEKINEQYHGSLPLVPVEPDRLRKGMRILVAGREEDGLGEIIQFRQNQQGGDLVVMQFDDIKTPSVIPLAELAGKVRAINPFLQWLLEHDWNLGSFLSGAREQGSVPTEVKDSFILGKLEIAEVVRQEIEQRLTARAGDLIAVAGELKLAEEQLRKLAGDLGIEIDSGDDQLEGFFLSGEEGRLPANIADVYLAGWRSYQQNNPGAVLAEENPREIMRLWFLGQKLTMFQLRGLIDFSEKEVLKHLAVYFIFDRHYFKAKDLRDYQELANIRKRYLAVVKSGDRFPWKTIADEEDMDLAAFKKILLVYAAIACGGQREQMAEFLSLEKDTLIVYLSEHHLTAATDQVKFAAEKIAAFKEAAARLEKMLDQDERSERRSQSEQSSSDAMVFLLELCVLEELLNELSLLVEINPHLYLYYTIMEAAMQQMETKIDNEIIVTEEHVLRELGQLAEDSLAALKEQDLSHRSIWKIILNYGTQIEQQADWQDKQALLAERNYWREKLWQLAQADYSSGLGILWQQLAGQLGCGEKEIKRSIYSYFMESAAGNLQEMVKAASGKFTEGSIKQEITNIGLFDYWLLVQALAAARERKDLSTDERRKIVEEFLAGNHQHDAAFPCFSYTTTTSGAKGANTAYVPFYQRQKGDEVKLLRFRKGIIQAFGLGAPVRVRSVFSKSYGWLFRINKIDPGTHSDLADSPVLYFIKKPAEFKMALLDVAEERLELSEGSDSVSPPTAAVPPVELPLPRLKLLDAEAGKEQMLLMLAENKFTDPQYQPAPFRLKTRASKKGAEVKAGIFHFGNVKATAYQASIYSQKLQANTEYEIQFNFSIALKKWICFAYQIQADGRLAAQPAIIFSGRVKGQKTVLYHLSIDYRAMCLREKEEARKEKPAISPVLLAFIRLFNLPLAEDAAFVEDLNDMFYEEEKRILCEQIIKEALSVEEWQQRLHAADNNEFSPEELLEFFKTLGLMEIETEEAGDEKDPAAADIIKMFNIGWHHPKPQRIKVREDGVLPIVSTDTVTINIPGLAEYKNEILNVIFIRVGKIISCLVCKEGVYIGRYYLYRHGMPYLQRIDGEDTGRVPLAAKAIQGELERLWKIACKDRADRWNWAKSGGQVGMSNMELSFEMTMYVAEVCEGDKLRMAKMLQVKEASLYGAYLNNIPGLLEMIEALKRRREIQKSDGGSDDEEIARTKQLISFLKNSTPVPKPHSLAVNAAGRWQLLDQDDLQIELTLPESCRGGTVWVSYYVINDQPYVLIWPSEREMDMSITVNQATANYNLLWELVRGTPKRWTQWAKKLEVDYGELRHRILVFVAQECNGDLAEMARMLLVKKTSLMNNYLVSYRISPSTANFEQQRINQFYQIFAENPRAEEVQRLPAAIRALYREIVIMNRRLQELNRYLKCYNDELAEMSTYLQLAEAIKGKIDELLPELADPDLARELTDHLCNDGELPGYYNLTVGDDDVLRLARGDQLTVQISGLESRQKVVASFLREGDVFCCLLTTPDRRYINRYYLLRRDEVYLQELNGQEIDRDPLPAVAVAEEVAGFLQEAAKMRQKNWNWRRAADRLSIERKELVFEIILYVVEKCNGDRAKIAEMLGVSAETVATTYLKDYKLRELAAALERREADKAAVDAAAAAPDRKEEPAKPATAALAKIGSVVVADILAGRGIIELMQRTITVVANLMEGTDKDSLAAIFTDRLPQIMEHLALLRQQVAELQEQEDFKTALKIAQTKAEEAAERVNEIRVKMKNRQFTDDIAYWEGEVVLLPKRIAQLNMIYTEVAELGEYQELEDYLADIDNFRSLLIVYLTTATQITENSDFVRGKEKEAETIKTEVLVEIKEAEIEMDLDLCESLIEMLQEKIVAMEKIRAAAQEKTHYLDSDGKIEIAGLNAYINIIDRHIAKLREDELTRLQQLIKIRDGVRKREAGVIALKEEALNEVRAAESEGNLRELPALSQYMRKLEEKISAMEALITKMTTDTVYPQLEECKKNAEAAAYAVHSELARLARIEEAELQRLREIKANLLFAEEKAVEAHGILDEARAEVEKRAVTVNLDKCGELLAYLEEKSASIKEIFTAVKKLGGEELADHLDRIAGYQEKLGLLCADNCQIKDNRDYVRAQEKRAARIREETLAEIAAAGLSVSLDGLEGLIELVEQSIDKIEEILPRIKEMTFYFSSEGKMPIPGLEQYLTVIEAHNAQLREELTKLEELKEIREDVRSGKEQTEELTDKTLDALAEAEEAGEFRTIPALTKVMQMIEEKLPQLEELLAGMDTEIICAQLEEWQVEALAEASILRSELSRLERVKEELENQPVIIDEVSITILGTRFLKESIAGSKPNDISALIALLDHKDCTDEVAAAIAEALKLCEFELAVVWMSADLQPRVKKAEKVRKNRILLEVIREKAHPHKDLLANLQAMTKAADKETKQLAGEILAGLMDSILGKIKENLQSLKTRAEGNLVGAERRIQEAKIDEQTRDIRRISGLIVAIGKVNEEAERLVKEAEEACEGFDDPEITQLVEDIGESQQAVAEILAELRKTEKHLRENPVLQEKGAVRVFGRKISHQDIQTGDFAKIQYLIDCLDDEQCTDKVAESILNCLRMCDNDSTFAMIASSLQPLVRKPEKVRKNKVILQLIKEKGIQHKEILKKLKQLVRSPDKETKKIAGELLAQYPAEKPPAPKKPPKPKRKPAAAKKPPAPRKQPKPGKKPAQKKPARPAAAKAPAPASDIIDELDLVQDEKWWVEAMVDGKKTTTLQTVESIDRRGEKITLDKFGDKTVIPFSKLDQVMIDRFVGQPVPSRKPARRTPRPGSKRTLDSLRKPAARGKATAVRRPTPTRRPVSRAQKKKGIVEEIPADAVFDPRPDQYIYVPMEGGFYRALIKRVDNNYVHVLVPGSDGAQMVNKKWLEMQYKKRGSSMRSCPMKKPYWAEEIEVNDRKLTEESMAVKEPATQYRTIGHRGKAIIVRESLLAGMGYDEQEFLARLSQALALSNKAADLLALTNCDQDPSVYTVPDWHNLPDTLFIEEMSASPYLGANHKADNWIGINRALFEVDNKTTRDILFSSTLLHELWHELNPRTKHKLELLERLLEFHDGIFLAAALIQAEDLTFGKFFDSSCRIIDRQKQKLYYLLNIGRNAHIRKLVNELGNNDPVQYRQAARQLIALGNKYQPEREKCLRDRVIWTGVKPEVTVQGPEKDVYDQERWHTLISVGNKIFDEIEWQWQYEQEGDLPFMAIKSEIEDLLLADNCALLKARLRATLARELDPETEVEWLWLDKFQEGGEAGVIKVTVRMVDGQEVKFGVISAKNSGKGSEIIKGYHESLAFVENLYLAHNDEIDTVLPLEAPRGYEGGYGQEGIYMFCVEWLEDTYEINPVLDQAGRVVYRGLSRGQEAVNWSEEQSKLIKERAIMIAATIFELTRGEIIRISFARGDLVTALRENTAFKAFWLIAADFFLQTDVAADDPQKIWQKLLAASDSLEEKYIYFLLHCLTAMENVYLLNREGDITKNHTVASIFPEPEIVFSGLTRAMIRLYGQEKGRQRAMAIIDKFSQQDTPLKQQVLVYYATMSEGAVKLQDVHAVDASL